MDKQAVGSKYAASLLILGVLYFTFVGHSGYLEMKDTIQFKFPGIREGVMPVYPLFLNLVRFAFKDNYLSAAAFLQGIIAAVCVAVFVCRIVVIFGLRKAEGYLLWIACLLPFSVELPEYVITHMIYTESISYACYYIYALCLVYAVMLRSRKWLWITFGMSLFMSLIRSQLLLLYVMWALIAIYVDLVQGQRKFAALIKGILTALVGVLLGVVLTYTVRGLYVTTLDRIFVNYFDVGDNVEQEEIEEIGNMAEADQSAIMRANTSQFGSAVIVRGFFEADAEDVRYYKTKEMQDIFLKTYEKCDEKGYSYRYVGSGLWMWEDLTKPYIYDVVSEAISEYCEENGTTELYAKQTQIKLQLGITEIFAHPVRFMYHSFRLMIPGFISCVFFNIEGIYLLCHIITLFLYVSALVMAVVSIKNKRCDSRTGIFMLLVVTGCIIFVGITNMIFFGMQRYFLYQMGIFYCAYYLVFRQMCTLFAGTKTGQNIRNRLNGKR